MHFLNLTVNGLNEGGGGGGGGQTLVVWGRLSFTFLTPPPPWSTFKRRNTDRVAGKRYVSTKERVPLWETLEPRQTIILLIWPVRHNWIILSCEHETELASVHDTVSPSQIASWLSQVTTDDVCHHKRCRTDSSGTSGTRIHQHHQMECIDSCRMCVHSTMSERSTLS